MVRDHGNPGNPRIAVVLFHNGYRFIYCTLCQDGDCDVTVRTLYSTHAVRILLRGRYSCALIIDMSRVSKTLTLWNGFWLYNSVL